MEWNCSDQHLFWTGAGWGITSVCDENYEGSKVYLSTFINKMCNNRQVTPLSVLPFLYL